MQVGSGQSGALTAFTIMLLMAAAGHIALGTTYIQYGEYISQFQTGGSLYKQVLPFSSFAIVVGGLLFIYIILANVNLRGFKSSFLITNASWNACWLTTGLSFAVTVIAILVFAKFTILIRDAGIAASDLPNKVGAVYWCSLADGIAGLFLAFPAGFKLMALENDNKLEDGTAQTPRQMEMHTAGQQYNNEMNQFNSRWN